MHSLLQFKVLPILLNFLPQFLQDIILFFSSNFVLSLIRISLHSGEHDLSLGVDALKFEEQIIQVFLSHVLFFNLVCLFQYREPQSYLQNLIFLAW